MLIKKSAPEVVSASALLIFQGNKLLINLRFDLFIPKSLHLCDKHSFKSPAQELMRNIVESFCTDKAMRHKILKAFEAFRNGPSVAVFTNALLILEINEL